MSKGKQSALWLPDTYWPGDFVGLRPSGRSRIVAVAMSKVFTPATELEHWFLIGKYIPEENDYVIYESIPSHGVAVGRLSWYDGCIYQVYRVNRPDAAAIGVKIIDEVSLFGRRDYGYLSILDMLAGIINIERNEWQKYKRLRRVTMYDMSGYMSRTGELCTQLVHDVPLRLGIDILPKGMAALPPAFIAAAEAGIIREVTQGAKAPQEILKLAPATKGA
jgi:hypothetical protein